MNIIRLDMLMDVGSVVFGRVIAQIFLPGLVEKFEVFPSITIEKPEVTHFHSAGALLFDGVVDDTNGGSVVNMY